MHILQKNVQKDFFKAVDLGCVIQKNVHNFDIQYQTY